MGGGGRKFAPSPAEMLARRMKIAPKRSRAELLSRLGKEVDRFDPVGDLKAWLKNPTPENPDVEDEDPEEHESRLSDLKNLKDSDVDLMMKDESRKGMVVGTDVLKKVRKFLDVQRETPPWYLESGPNLRKKSSNAFCGAQAHRHQCQHRIEGVFRSLRESSLTVLVRTLTAPSRR